MLKEAEAQKEATNKTIRKIANETHEQIGETSGKVCGVEKEESY